MGTEHEDTPAEPQDERAGGGFLEDDEAPYAPRVLGYEPPKDVDVTSGTDEATAPEASPGSDGAAIVEPPTDVESTSVIEAVGSAGTDAPETGGGAPAGQGAPAEPDHQAPSATGAPVAVPPAAARPRPSSEPRRFGERQGAAGGVAATGATVAGVPAWEPRPDRATPASSPPAGTTQPLPPVSASGPVPGEPTPQVPPTTPVPPTSPSLSVPQDPPAPTAPRTTPAAAAYMALQARSEAQSAAPVGGTGADGTGGDGGDVLQGVGSDDAPSRWPKVALWSGVGVVVLLGLYVGAQWMYADKVPSGTTVAGVDVGGMSHDEAGDAIDAGLATRAKEPVPVQVGEATTSIDPVAAGLTVDGPATADTLTGFSLSPARLWQHLFGGKDVAPVVDADPTALEAAVTTAAGSVDVAPVDGTVSFVDGAPTSTDAKDGTSVVVDEAMDAVTDGWLVSTAPIELPTTSAEPEITQAETDAALEEAGTVVSAPVAVTVGDQSVELPPEALAGAATYVPTDGDLVLTWDGDTLVDDIIDRTNDLLTDPEDAHFEFVDGKPTVVGGAEGTTIEADAVAKSVGAAAVSDDRTASVELVSTDPENSAEALEALGVKEKIVDFSTPLTNEPVRTQNLVVGSEKITGMLVKPGETFSVLDALSPITAENGYGDAHIVTDGIVVDGTGGGLSQMATNTYNIGFFAGYENVAYKPHSYWYDRYPEGRESTMFVPSIDMKWTNDTPYGVVLQAWVGGGRLHTVAWSTKYWDVTSSTGERRNVVKTTTQTSDSSSCVPSAAGNDGFTVTVYRKVSHDGTVDKDEARSWTYKPQNAIACE